MRKKKYFVFLLIDRRRIKEVHGGIVSKDEASSILYDVKTRHLSRKDINIFAWRNFY